jgi:hypothetical protein
LYSTVDCVGPETSSEEVEVKKRGFKERLKGVRVSVMLEFLLLKVTYPVQG